MCFKISKTVRRLLKFPLLPSSLKSAIALRSLLPQQHGCKNPQYQRLYAALTDGYRPNNVLDNILTIANDYSPLWDINLFEWTQDAPNNGDRTQLREEFHILGYCNCLTQELKAELRANSHVFLSENS